MLRLHGTTAFAAGLGCERTILRKTALLMRHVGTALAGNFALLVLLHAGETAQRSGTLALVVLSHAVTSCLVVIRPESAKSTDWQRLGFPHSRSQGAAVWQRRAEAVPLGRSPAHRLGHVWPRDCAGLSQGLSQGLSLGLSLGLRQGLGQGLRLALRAALGHRHAGPTPGARRAGEASVGPSRRPNGLARAP